MSENWIDPNEFKQWEKAKKAKEAAEELARKQAEGGEPGILGNLALLGAHLTGIANEIMDFNSGLARARRRKSPY